MDIDTLDPKLLAAGFRPVAVDHCQDKSALSAVAATYQRMLLCMLTMILERAERDKTYGFLDTKIDLISGQDFAPSDPLRGRETVYVWIQGRGLEALAGHAAWVIQSSPLRPELRRELADRIRQVSTRLVRQVQRLRSANGGRLSFMMTPEGQPLGVNESGGVVNKPLPHDGPANFSELFACKGLAATAMMQGDWSLMHEARVLFARVCDDIRSGRFTSDQEPLDPQNPVRPVPGRFSVGPWMIAIGAAALYVELTGEQMYADLGSTLIEHVLHHHVQRSGRAAVGQEGDMWEFVDAWGQPFRENAVVRSDPGHATEFAGLALKFLRVCEAHGLSVGQTSVMRESLCAVLRCNFANGFSQNGIGICKAFDLIRRTPLNADMPWWSLPETMRAGMEAWKTARGDEKSQYAQIACRCSNAFMRYYIRPDRWLMANQTVGVDGRPVAAIPATPDADPAYHTGLSLIDYLALLQ